MVAPAWANERSEGLLHDRLRSWLSGDHGHYVDIRHSATLFRQIDHLHRSDAGTRPDPCVRVLPETQEMERRAKLTI